MGHKRRLGIATVEVLGAIAEGHRYGFDIMDITGLPGGTVYPALARLEGGRLVRSSWEDPEVSRAEGRPPRRYYEMTAQGRRELERQLARLRRLATPDRGPGTEPGPTPAPRKAQS